MNAPSLWLPLFLLSSLTLNSMGEESEKGRIVCGPTVTWASDVTERLKLERGGVLTTEDRIKIRLPQKDIADIVVFADEWIEDSRNGWIKLAGAVKVSVVVRGDTIVSVECDEAKITRNQAG